jgi:hypothetical protein
MNFNNQQPAIFSWFLMKVVLLKDVLPFKIYQHIKCHGLKETGGIFTYTSEVWTFWNG